MDSIKSISNTVTSIFNRQDEEIPISPVNNVSIQAEEEPIGDTKGREIRTVEQWNNYEDFASFFKQVLQKEFNSTKNNSLTIEYKKW